MRASTVLAASLLLFSGGAVVAQDVSLDWQVERTRVLGLEEPVFGDLTSRGLAAGRNGDLYVLDIQAETAFHFTDSLGRWSVFAREGEGPGELRFPWGLTRLWTEEIAVQDRGHAGLLVYDEDGTFERQIPLPFRMDRQSRIEAFDTSLVHEEVTMRVEVVGPALRRGDRRIPDAFGGHVMRYRIDGETVATEGESLTEIPPEAFTRTDPDCRTVILDLPVFTPRVRWDANDSLVVIAPEAAYVLTLLRRDGQRLQFGREMPVRSADFDSAAEEIGPIAGSDTEPCHLSARERARRAGWAGTMNWILDVGLTETGEVLVRRRSRSGSHSRIDVFSAGGQYRGTLPADFPWPDIWLTDTWFATIDEDEFGVETLSIYEMSRN